MQAPSFHCRGCHSVHKKETHSQKECLTKKRIQKIALEDLDFERTEFIKRNNLKRTSKSSNSTLSTSETATVGSPKSTAENIPNKKVNFDPTICKIPRTLRRRKIAPVQQWYGTTHNYPAKEQINK